MSPRSGSRITASLELRRPLGAGGMGAVWVAWHAGLHTEVVVKLIARELAADAAMVARFSREAAAAARVRIPHVVQIFDHGVTASGQPYIAMEKLEGESLGARLERRHVVPPAELVEVISQCGKALARAHESGVVHRDIKPDNVFLTDLGGGDVFVKVLDFGIAKAELVPGGATTTGAVLGSPFYMSPEQVLGKRVDFRTDLWSLGVLAYEALLGVRPFHAETIGALSILICQGPLPVPSTLQPRLPRAFDVWFAQACARDPASRFASARAMTDALGAALAGAPKDLGPVASHLALAQTELLGATTSVGVTAAPIAGVGWRRWALVGGLVAAGGVAGLVAWAVGGPSTPAVEAQGQAPSLASEVALDGSPVSSVTTSASASAAVSASQAAASPPSLKTPQKKPAGTVAPASPTPAVAVSASASAKPATTPKLKDDHDPAIY